MDASLGGKEGMKGGYRPGASKARAKSKISERVGSALISGSWKKKYWIKPLLLGSIHRRKYIEQKKRSER